MLAEKRLFYNNNIYCLNLSIFEAGLNLPDAYKKKRCSWVFTLYNFKAIIFNNKPAVWKVSTTIPYIIYINYMCYIYTLRIFNFLCLTTSISLTLSVLMSMVVTAQWATLCTELSHGPSTLGTTLFGQILARRKFGAIGAICLKSPN